MIDPVSNSLEKYMDLVATSQKLTAANIANADTPGYRTQTINFQEEFENLTSNGLAPHIIEAGDLKMKNDGNDVSIDREARMLSENALRFRLASTLLKDRFSAIKQAIQGEK